MHETEIFQGPRRMGGGIWAVGKLVLDEALCSGPSLAKWSHVLASVYG